MNIEIRDIITLSDNNKYVVCSKVNYQNNNYLYLIDINDHTNIKFCLEVIRDNTINVDDIEDEQLIQTLLPLLFDEAKEVLDNLE